MGGLLTFLLIYSFNKHQLNAAEFQLGVAPLNRNANTNTDTKNVSLTLRFSGSSKTGGKMNV